jgi:hypothetical protein
MIRRMSRGKAAHSTRFLARPYRHHGVVSKAAAQNPTNAALQDVVTLIEMHQDALEGLHPDIPAAEQLVWLLEAGNTQAVVLLDIYQNAMTSILGDTEQTPAVASGAGAGDLPQLLNAANSQIQSLKIIQSVISSKADSRDDRRGPSAGKDNGNSRRDHYKPQRDLDDFRCFTCGGKGHLSTTCTSAKRNKRSPSPRRSRSPVRRSPRGRGNQRSRSPVKRSNSGSRPSSAGGGRSSRT